MKSPTLTYKPIHPSIKMNNTRVHKNSQCQQSRSHVMIQINNNISTLKKHSPVLVILEYIHRAAAILEYLHHDQVQKRDYNVGRQKD